MKREDLVKAQVVGFFSLPHSSLAERNPEAFNNAWREAGPGAGSCAYCGMGILHHVVIQLPDGSKAFIGSDCAEKIGGEVSYCVRDRLTSEQRAERQAKRDAQLLARKAELEAITAKKAARRELFKDVFKALDLADLEARRFEHEQTFWASLAGQLEWGPLSPKQANCVCKLILGRCTKKNVERWDALHDRLCP